MVVFLELSVTLLSQKDDFRIVMLKKFEKIKIYLKMLLSGWGLFFYFSLSFFYSGKHMAMGTIDCQPVYEALVYRHVQNNMH